MITEQQAVELAAWAKIIVDGEPAWWPNTTKHENAAHMVWLRLTWDYPDLEPRWYGRALLPHYWWRKNEVQSEILKIFARKKPTEKTVPAKEMVVDAVRDMPPNDPLEPLWAKYHALPNMVRELKQGKWDIARLYRQHGMLYQPGDLIGMTKHRWGSDYAMKEYIRRSLDDD